MATIPNTPESSRGSSQENLVLVVDSIMRHSEKENSSAAGSPDQRLLVRVVGKGPTGPKRPPMNSWVGRR